MIEVSTSVTEKPSQEAVLIASARQESVRIEPRSHSRLTEQLRQSSVYRDEPAACVTEEAPLRAAGI